MKYFKVMVILLAFACIGTYANAQDVFWKGGTDSNPLSWSVPDNWNNGAVPTSGENVFIDSGSSYTPVVYDQAAPISLGELRLDNKMELQLPDGYELDTLHENIGILDYGTFTQNGGVHNVINYGFNYYNNYVVTDDGLNLGVYSTGVGVYNLNDGKLNARSQSIGVYGRGVFNQNGGVNDLSTSGINLGLYSTGFGEYNLNDGEVFAVGENIGYEGQGRFNQNGGVNSISLSLGVDGDPTGVNMYNLNNGELHSAYESVGYIGKGIINQSGGHNITDRLDLAGGIGVGEYNLNNGELDVGEEYLGLGYYGGVGTFQQSGGVHNVFSTLHLGGGGVGAGIYYLNNGELNSGLVAIDRGVFDQNGGVNNISTALNIGSPTSTYANYEMEGGTLNVGQIQRNGDGQEVGFTPGSITNNGVFSIYYGTVDSPILVRGDITNNHRFVVARAVVKFEGSIQNKDSFYSDHSVMNFTDLTIGASGYLKSFVGDQFKISGNFVNDSQLNTLWFTGNSQLMFDSGVHIFQPNGVDKGAMQAGFDENFAWGDVSFGNGKITLTSLTSGQLSALYAGTVSGLDISGNMVSNLFGDVNVYYVAGANPELFAGGDNGIYTFAGGGKLIPVVTPEPVALLLYGIGGLPLAARFLHRRRKDVVNG